MYYILSRFFLGFRTQLNYCFFYIIFFLFFVSEYLLTDFVVMLSKRQKQIIEESINVINSKGIQGFTIKNLAKALNLTEAAIYRHFKSKTEILCAILDNFISILTEFANNISATKISSLEKIETIFDRLTKTFVAKPAYVSVIFAEEIFKNTKTLTDKVNIILKKNNDTFNEIIEEGQSLNQITKKAQSQELTLMVMGAFRLMVKNWRMCEFTTNLEESSKRLYNSIELMIKA